MLALTHDGVDKDILADSAIKLLRNCCCVYKIALYLDAYFRLFAPCDEFLRLLRFPGLFLFAF